MRRAWMIAVLVALCSVIVLSVVAFPAAAAPKPIVALAPVEVVLDGQRELTGVAVAPDAIVYVSDRKAGVVFRLAPTGQLAIAVGGLDHPAGLAVDASGRLLIAEERQDRVLRLESSGALSVLASGIRRPRWLAVAPDDTLYIAAHRLLGPDGSDPDEAKVIVRRAPSGALDVVATNVRHLEGLALNTHFLFAAARRVEGLGSNEGVIVRYPLLGDGALGAPAYFVAAGLEERPTGLILDRLGALYVTSKEIRIGRAKAKRAIGKVHQDAHLTVFAQELEDAQGVALAPDGSVYLADGDSGRLIRFRALPAPTLTGLPEFTNQSPVAVTGTTIANARVDVFVNDAATPASVTAMSTGAFTAQVTLTLNTSNALEIFATAHRGDGLTGVPAAATIVHDNIAPTLVFQAPPAGAHIRLSASVQAQATDGGGGVANLALSAGAQPLNATLLPTPPAPTVTASTTWDTTRFGDGAVGLTATATDRAGNSATVTRSVLVDNTPPDTQILSGPAGEISERTATFTFTGADNLAPVASLQFAWSFDGDPFTEFSLATSATFTNLAEEPHTFEVKARDLAGNEDPTPASRTFRVSTGPTVTAVDPANGTIGTLVAITGVGFEPGATGVRFSGVAAVIRTINATTITTTVPVGAATGLLVVTTSRGTASRTFTVTTTGEFTLTASPTTARVIAGDQTSVSIAADGGGSFASLVSLSVSPPPAGIGATLDSAFAAPGASTFVTLNVASAVTPGTYAFTVTGQAQVDGRTLTRSASFALEVLSPQTTAITGRVLTADAVPQPIPGVTVTLGSAFTLTDSGGNFVLLQPPAGPNMLFVDGRTASTPTAQFPIVETQVNIGPSGATRVPFIIYLPKLDTANAVPLPTDSTGTVRQTVQATTPAIPDLTITIPANTRITDGHGNPVAELVITPVPIDRTPMPFPPGVAPALLFAINPGGATPSQPLPISFPNTLSAAPATRADLYYFDLAAGNWRIWGTGTVSPDGKRIVSDPGFGLPRLAWHFAFSPTSLSDQVRNRNAKGGEPVDLVTGRFTVSKTDLVLPGRLPVTIQRHYRSENPQVGLLGIGWNLDVYDTRLTTAGTSLSLILPDQSTYLLTPSGPGQWTNTTEPFLRGAVATQLPGDFIFQIRFKDGTVQRFERILGFANLAALTGITDRNGNAVTLTRQSVFQQNRITQITEAGGRKLTLTYDTAGRIIAITDPLGRQVQYTYDAVGRLTTVMDAAGGTTRYTYDANHRILTITDPRNITFLTNEYDADGRVIRQTQADGGVWSFAYTVTGNLVTATTLTDPRGNPTTHRFSSQGFTLSTTDALGQTTSFAYTPENLLAATTDALGRTTRIDYDMNGNVTRLTDPAGGTYTFTYEPAFNRVKTVTDPVGNVRTFEYDARGNLTAAVDPLGHRTAVTYDAVGRPVTFTNRAGNTMVMAYDAVGHLVTITDALGNATTRTFDPASRLLSVTDPRGRTTSYVYDALNRVVRSTDAVNGVTRFTYDGNGNLLTVVDALGGTVGHTYDAMDRLVTRADPLGAVEGFEYDAVGNPVRTTDRRGQVSTFSYDALNRRTAGMFADGTTTAFEYDAVGRLTRAADSAGGSILNGYTTLDRLASQTTALGTISYEYDGLSRRTAMSVPGQVPVTYEYDAASRLVRIAEGSQTVGLAYDALGRRTGLVLPNGVSTEYQYDAASRLIALIYKNSSGALGTLSYDYDGAGNRIQIGGSLAGTLLPSSVAVASYDPANRQRAFGDATLTYDANGSLTSLTEPAGTTTFGWDPRNRLVGISGPGGHASLEYDALGRRRARTIDGSTTQYLYDGLDIVLEVATTAVASYLRGPGLDEPLVRNGTEFYLATDLGSIVALTDPGGTIVTSYSYDPFGGTQLTAGASGNPFQYTARENDEIAGLYWYRSRPYSPRLHRFLTEDLIGLFGGINLYRYVGNNPTSYTDPLGLDVDVYYFRGGFSDGGYHFPHAAILVNGNVYSFYPQPQARLRSSFMRVPGEIRMNFDDPRIAADVGVIPTTEADDALIEGILKDLSQTQELLDSPLPYNALGNGALNCVRFIAHVLSQAGVKFPDISLPHMMLPMFRSPEMGFTPAPVPLLQTP